jgi:hypothetical protein
MLTIHHYLFIQNAVRDLKEQPAKSYFSQGWPETIAWFKERGLPGFLEHQAEKKSGTTGVTTVVPNKKVD